MDSTPLKRSADCNQDFESPHFKPLWEPYTAIGRNAIRYSLVHHVYQKLISNAGLCTFCTNELTRRVSEAARRLKSKDLFHGDTAFMDLFWQDENDGAPMAGETIVTTNKHGDKIAVADHAVELSYDRFDADRDWWRVRALGFQREIAAADRSEAHPSRGRFWLGLGSGPPEMTPWQTRFLAVIWTYTPEDTALGIEDFVEFQEQYLNYTHESCQCIDVQHLRRGTNFEDLVMERVMANINSKVWEAIPFPPRDTWQNKARFLTYIEEQLKGVQSQESRWDYAVSRGEVNVGASVVPRHLPQGWQRRWVSNNTVRYHDSRGNLIARGEPDSSLPNVPSATQRSTIDEEEDLIEL